MQLDNQGLLTQYQHKMMKKIIKKWKAISQQPTQRLLLIVEFIAKEHQYISDLKHQLLQFTIVMKEWLGINHSWVRSLFNTIENIIQIETITIKKLQNIKNNFQLEEQKIPHIFTTFLSFVKANLYDYYQKMPQFLKMAQINPSFRVRQLLQYFFKPFEQLISYRSFINDYNSFDPPPDFQQVLSAYQNVLSSIFHSQTFLPSPAIYTFLSEKLDRFLDLSEKNESFPISFEFDCTIEYDEYKLIICWQKIYIARMNKKVLQNTKTITLNDLSFIREYSQSLFEEEHEILFYVCGQNYGFHAKLANKNMYIIFKQIINLKIAYLQKNKQPNQRKNLYKETIYNFKVQFVPEAVQLRKQVQYIIKMILPQYDNICQYLKISLQEIASIEEYWKRMHPNAKIRWFLQYNEMINEEEPFKKRQAMCFILAQFLNSLFRCQQFCTNPNYVIYNLGINQGIWQLLTKNRNCTCMYCAGQPENEHIFPQIVDNSKICALYLFRIEKKWRKNEQKHKVQINIRQKLNVINYQLWNQYLSIQKLCGSTVYNTKVIIDGEQRTINGIHKDMTVRQVIKKIDHQENGYLWIKTKKYVAILNKYQIFIKTLKKYDEKKQIFYDKVFSPEYKLNSKGVQSFVRKSTVASSTILSFVRKSLDMEPYEQKLCFKVYIINLKTNGELKIAWDGIRLGARQFEKCFSYQNFSCEIFSSTIFFHMRDIQYTVSSNHSYSLFRIICTFQELFFQNSYRHHMII